MTENLPVMRDGDLELLDEVSELDLMDEETGFARTGAIERAMSFIIARQKTSWTINDGVPVRVEEIVV